MRVHQRTYFLARIGRQVKHEHREKADAHARYDEINCETREREMILRLDDVGLYAQNASAEALRAEMMKNQLFSSLSNRKLFYTVRVFYVKSITLRPYMKIFVFLNYSFCVECKSFLLPEFGTLGKAGRCVSVTCIE